MDAVATRIENALTRGFGTAFDDAEARGDRAAIYIGDTFRKLKPVVGITYDYDDEPEPPGPPGPDNPRGYASGAAFIPLAPMPIYVHPNELVDITPLPELRQSGQSRAGLGAGAGSSFSLTVNGPLIQSTGDAKTDARETIQEIEQELKRRGVRLKYV